MPQLRGEYGRCWTQLSLVNIQMTDSQDTGDFDLRCIQTPSVRSRNGNKYAQVYCTRSGWTLAIPMQSKSDAHETLSLLFSRHGVPNILIVDGAKNSGERSLLLLS